MKRFIIGFVCGALVFGVVGALAVEYNVTPNPFKVLVDGKEVQMEGYNINDRSYFQLRDIGKAIGFSVGFVDGAVVLDSTEKVIENTSSLDTPPSVSDEEYPKWDKTKDGLYMCDFGDGIYYVQSSYISEKFRENGKNYLILDSNLIDCDTPSWQCILSDIPTIRNGLYTPVNYYYYNVLLPLMD